MKKNNEKTTVVSDILKRIKKTNKYSTYKISKTTGLSEKTVKKILENTGSNLAIKTIKKILLLEELEKDDKEELKNIISKKTEKSTKIKKINNKNNIQKKTYEEIIQKIEKFFSKDRKKYYTKEQLKEYEQEIIETYDLMRDEKSDFSKIASINRELININKMLEESFLKLELLFEEDNDFLKKKIRRPLLSTIKNLEFKKGKLEDLVNTITVEKLEKKEKKMDISNLITEVPLSKFTREQKRIAILVWVAQNIKIRLKYYNFDKKVPTGYSTRLWVDGRKGNQKTKMESTVLNNIAMNIGSASDEEEIKDIMCEISEGIIENAMIVTEEFLKAARNAKTPAVRNRYIKASNNPEYLKVAFVISTLYYAKRLKGLGQDLNHKVLEIRIQSLDEKKKELDGIWKEYGKGNIDYLEATERTDRILEIYESQITLSNLDAEKMVEEKMIYSLMGEKNLEILVEKIVDNIRERVTGQISLFKDEETIY